MRVSVSVLAMIVLGGSTLAASAGTLDYPGGGPTAAVPLTASASGAITGYFVGSNAGDPSVVAMLDVTTGVSSGYTFQNHSTASGTEYDFGTVTAGDSIVFLLENGRTGTVLRSDAQNADGAAHAWVTEFAGGSIGGADFPAGEYVSFEDLLASQNSDFDYNDNAFIFTNVGPAGTVESSPAPEPSTLALLGSGALGLAGVVRRRTVDRRG